MNNTNRTLDVGAIVVPFGSFLAHLPEVLSVMLMLLGCAWYAIQIHMWWKKRIEDQAIAKLTKKDLKSLTQADHEANG